MEPNRAATLRLVLGDQLNENHSWFAATEPDALVVLMEIRPETEYVTHHVQKLLAVFGAMRRFAARLRELGHRVLYLEIDETRNRQTFLDNLAWIAKESGARSLQMQQPDEYRLHELLAPERVRAELAARMSREIEVSRAGSEHFLVERDEAARFLPENKSPVMETFYRKVRRRYGWLMEEGDGVDGERPVGGVWNLDTENREPWREDGNHPTVPGMYHAHIDLSVEMAAIEKSGCAHFGEANAGDSPWPITRPQALEALSFFVTRLLPYFGTYQDAMHSRERSLFHSRLSFAVNVKLISPAEVIEAALSAWHETGGLNGQVGLNQVEGFVRQIAGWREYMRLLYWRMMPGLAEANALGADRPLPGWYWTGKTGMNCLSHAIRASLQEAYAHHIQRLMVTGAFAMMAGVDPVEVDEWYLGIYIDAFDWVERPNTRGMSQYADGGVIGTKPYAGSANYINRQSDYCPDCRYNNKTRSDEDSCPFNALYWDFYARNPELRRNGRIRFVYPTLGRMKDEDLAALRARAAWLRDHLEEL